jgi:hypothetical protein
MFFLAELYLPTTRSLASVTYRARVGAAQAAGAGTDIGFVEAIFLPRDESCFLLYRAGCAADVSVAGLLTGLAFDRVSEAMVGEGCRIEGAPGDPHK